MLTVKALIAKLKKMPPEAIVIWRDHDNGFGDMNGYVNYVAECDEEFIEERINRGDTSVRGKRMVEMTT